MKTSADEDRALAKAAEEMDGARELYILCFHDCRDIESDLKSKRVADAIYNHYLEIQEALADDSF